MLILAQAADAAESVERTPLIQHPMGILAVLMAVLAVLFWFNERSTGRKIFSIIPMLVFCYFVPTTLTTFGILPEVSPLYVWIKTYLLPCSLVLLILALDLPGIMRLGPKAVIMLLAGTTGVVIGGPVALLIFMKMFPESIPADTWQGLTALSGSWIGGGANMVALGDIAGVSSDMFAKMIIVDVFVANIWMGILLFAAGKQETIDRWTGADTSAIEDLKHRVAEFEAKTSRIPTLTDLIVITAIGFICMWLAYIGGNWLADKIIVIDSFATDRAREAQGPDAAVVMKPFLTATTWKFILVTTMGLLLSFTRARKLDGVGASKIGSLMLYILVASIGAHANFRAIIGAEVLVGLGAVWMLFHIVIMLGIGKLIRAPIFFIAVGSQANIGGAASAPIVASAFHPTLAPVGVLLAVAGYVLGTYAGLLCMWLMKIVAGAG